MIQLLPIFIPVFVNMALYGSKKVKTLYFFSSYELLAKKRFIGSWLVVIRIAVGWFLFIFFVKFWFLTKLLKKYYFALWLNVAIIWKMAPVDWNVGLGGASTFDLLVFNVILESFGALAIFLKWRFSKRYAFYGYDSFSLSFLGSFGVLVAKYPITQNGWS